MTKIVSNWRHTFFLSIIYQCYLPAQHQGYRRREREITQLQISTDVTPSAGITQLYMLKCYCRVLPQTRWTLCRRSLPLCEGEAKFGATLCAVTNGNELLPNRKQGSAADHDVSFCFYSLIKVNSPQSHNLKVTETIIGKKFI